MNVLESIDSHAHLDIGWRNGRGGPLSDTVIKAGKQLVYGILGDGSSEEDIEDFPLDDGRLLISFYSEIDHQFLISTDGLIKLTVVRNGVHNKIGDHLTVRVALRHFASRSTCPTFTTFTSGISVSGKSISGVALSSQTRMERYQSYWRNVQENVPVIRANTEEYFIPKSLGIPFYSSRSPRMNSRGTLASSSRQRPLVMNVTSTLRDAAQSNLKMLPTASRTRGWHEFPSVTGGPILQLPTNSSAGFGTISIAG